MFKINRTSIDALSKLPNSKNTLGETNQTLFDCYKQKIWNVLDLTSKFYIYEMSHWINNMDRWIHNRNVDNKKRYNRGSILIIDLGATNFRFEPSFTHPCIVLVDRFNTMLVVPCSSKKYGKGYPDIIDAQKVIDGFAENTGIQIENIRWVHKNRVASTVGTASPRVMEAIDQHLLSITPAYRRELVKFNTTKDNLVVAQQEIEKLRNDLTTSQQKIDRLNNEIDVLKAKIG